MSELYNKALDTICGPYLEKPDGLPMAWGEMTNGEQAMALWFARKHFKAKELEAVARHAVAQTAKREGGYNLETSNRIFGLFYDNRER